MESERSPEQPDSLNRLAEAAGRTVALSQSPNGPAGRPRTSAPASQVPDDPAAPAADASLHPLESVAYPPAGSTQPAIAARWAVAAAMTKPWKTSWKPNVAGQGSGRWIA